MKKVIFFLFLSVLINLNSEIPKELSFQGVLRDSTGNIVESGLYDLLLTIYSDSTGFDNLWQETHASVSITDGILNLIIGSINDLDLEFDQQYWLGITINSGDELTPLIKFTSSAYSFISQKSFDTEQIAGNPVMGDPELNNVLKWNGYEWAPGQDEVGESQESLWTQSGNNIFRINGNVGIGLNNPQYKLDILGDINFTGILHSGTVPVALVTGLADVATSGDYNDLIGTPNIAYEDSIPADNFTSDDVSNLSSAKLNNGTTPWTNANNIIQGILNNDRFNALSDLGGGSGLTFLRKDGSWTIPESSDSDWVISGDDIYREIGNVGIGVTSPNNKLDVSGNINTSTEYRIDDITTLKAIGTNLFVGFEAGIINSSGTFNTFIGNYSGYENTTGINNVFLGANAGRENGSGNHNVFIGNGAGYSNSNGFTNVFIGWQTGENNLSGGGNIFLGFSSGISHISGHYNTFLGEETGQTNQYGERNVFIGYRAGWSETGSNRLYIANSMTSNPLIYGEFDNDYLKINGDLDVTGTINSRRTHPENENMDIIYSCLESGETGTYVRGTGKLVNGEAKVSLPEHFSLVTSDDVDLTAQVTPRNDCNGLYVEKVNPEILIVKECQNGKSNIEFDYFINGVRKEFEYRAVIVNK